MQVQELVVTNVALASVKVPKSHQLIKPSTMTVRSAEGLFCQEVLSAVPEGARCPVDVYMAAFLQKKAQKEPAPIGHEPELQSKVDSAKTVEWETLRGKGAVQVWTGKEAARIIKTQADRFIGSRFVITQKDDEDGQRVKARLCVQGHLDPDFEAKINSRFKMLPKSNHEPVSTSPGVANTCVEALGCVSRRH